ncbi:MAG: YybH family protein [Acidobacteriota bacterium]
MKRIILVTLIIAASVTAAYSQNASATRKAIEANLKTFVAEFNKGNAAAVAQIYAADAQLLPPNDKMVEGRAAIQTFWQGAIGAGLKLSSLSIATLTPAGNLAVETGKYVSTIPAAGGGTTTDEGKYVVVWRREGRNWKIIRDIFNSDKPAQ